MSHLGGSDSDELAGRTHSSHPILDDTLNMKRLDPTYEKFVMERHSPQRRASISNSGDPSEGSTPNNSNVPAFRFDMETPMLKQFSNPFDVSPNEKSVADDLSTKFKTPLKIAPSRRSTQESSERNRLLGLIASPIAKAEKFRALKALQNLAGEDVYESLDYSNAGLVIETKKHDHENDEENDTNDDSSIQVNLIPTIRKQSQGEEDSIDSNAPTQADGNVHEIANQLSEKRREKSVKNGRSQLDDDDDDAFFLLEDNHHAEFGVIEAPIDDEEQKTMFVGKIERFSGNRNTQDSMKNDSLMKTSKRVDEDNKALTTSTQNISESDNENDNPISMSAISEILTTTQGIKETQKIENVSQIYSDEINDKFDSTQLSVIIDDLGDEDGEVIKNGRNILGTFKIEESQPQTSFISASQNDEHEPFLSGESDQLPFSGKPKTLIPETQKIDQEENEEFMMKDAVDETAKLPAMEVSSPIKYMTSNEEGANVDKTQGEVPNTSMASISKIDINMHANEAEATDNVAQNKIKTAQDITSTPITTYRKTQKKEVLSPKASRLTTKLNHALFDNSRPSTDTLTSNRPTIERRKLKRKFNISDIFDFTSIFYSDGTQKKPAYIVNVYEHDKEIVFGVKPSENEDEVLINKNKLFAPICIDVGSIVKYELNKRYNYIVTGLKHEKTEDDEHDRNDILKPYKDQLITLDGFNKVLLRKTSQNSGEEFEVNLKDIYLTHASSVKYRYRLFDDLDDFDRFVDYNLQKFQMLKATEKTDPNDTLSNMFLSLSTKENNIRNDSFATGKTSGCFSRCLFVITALSNPPVSAGSISNIPSTRISDSRTNTPRRNRKNDELSNLITFITYEGGTVIEQDAFDSIVKFKTNSDCQRKYIKTSPRKSKNVLTQNNKKHVNMDFSEYVCTKDMRDYYICNFVENCEFPEQGVSEIVEEFKDYDFACVLSVKHGRTLKYLECLCLKWPIIHVDFIKMCMEDEYMKRNWKSLWTKFMLVSGESKVLNCTTSLDIFQFYGKWKNGSKLEEQIGNNDSLKGFKILIINDTYEHFRDKLEFGKYALPNEDLSGKKRQKKPTKKANKRRKIGVGPDDDDDDDDSSDDESSDANTTLEVPDNGADGPNRTEILLWIYKTLGSDCCYVPKPSGSLENFFNGVILNEVKTKIFIYFRCGGNDNIDKFKRLIMRHYGEELANRCVNWEWMVQSIICGIPL